MRSLLQRIVPCFVLLLSTVVTIKAFAAADPPVKKVLDGSKNQIKVDSFVQVEDKFFDTAYTGKIDTPFYVKNIITLRINEDANVVLPDSFTAKVKVRIIYT